MGAVQRSASPSNALLQRVYLGIAVIPLTRSRPTGAPLAKVVHADPDVLQLSRQSRRVQPSHRALKRGAANLHQDRQRVGGGRLQNLQLTANADQDILGVAGFLLFEKVFQGFARPRGIGGRGVQRIDADDEGVARPCLPGRRYAAGSRFRERADIVNRSGGVTGKRCDLLRHAIFKDPEIRRMKPADVVASFVGYDNRHQHLLHVHPDGGFLGEQAPGRDEEDQAGWHLVHWQPPEQSYRLLVIARSPRGAGAFACQPRISIGFLRASVVKTAFPAPRTPRPPAVSQFELFRSQSGRRPYQLPRRANGISRHSHEDEIQHCYRLRLALKFPPLPLR